MNPSNYSWKKHEVPFDLYFFGTPISNGEKAYVYSANNNNEFWEFDGTSWTQKAKFIGPRRDGASMFAIGANIYLGIGKDVSGLSSISYQDFYKFDPMLNQWKPIQKPLFGGRLRTVSFVIDGLAYVTDGADNTGDFTMMRYNPVSDSWTYMADQNYSRQYSVAFSLKGKGYTAIGSSTGGTGSPESHEYDPITNQWSHGPPVGHKGRYRGFAFVLNGEVYVGGGAVEWNADNNGGGRDLLKWVKN
jgi:N-acetylneuraminic acid mutarotase